MNRKLATQSTTLAALCVTCLLSAALTQRLAAQANTPEPPTPATAAAKLPPHDRESYERWQASSVDRAYKFKYAASAQDANESLTALRNMLEPITKIFLVPNSGVIVVHAPEEEQARVLKMLNVLDQPHPRYRLTYTLTELDGTRKLGVQHFSMMVVSGQRMQMKQGSRLPVSAGGNQFTYLDVGMNFDLTLQEVQGGALLKEKVEQSSIAPDSATAANPNPVLRQTQLEGTTLLSAGKPQVVGSLDVPSSTHHFDVEVLLEPAS